MTRRKSLFTVYDEASPMPPEAWGNITTRASRFSYWPHPKYSQHIVAMVLNMRQYDRFGQKARAR